MSRAEIAAAVRRRRRGPAWPRDPDGAPLYPGAGARLVRRDDASERWRAASPTRSASTWRERCRASRRLSWSEADPFGVEPTAAHAGRSRRMGRRGAGAQGGAGELSPRRRRGRRVPGRHRRRARQGPRSRDLGASAAADAARPSRAALLPPPPDPRRERRETVEVARLGNDPRPPRGGRERRSS